MNKVVKMIRIISVVLGLCSLFYFGVYAMLAGLSNKFTYFWLLFGIFCMGVAWACPWIIRHFCMLPLQLRASLLGIVCVVILVFVIVEGLIITTGSGQPQPGADYVIVLGTQVKNRKPSYNLARRLDQAYEYLMENPKTQVILSGGKGEGEEVSEALAMAEYLEGKGIERERMILEDKSKNTDENLRYSREKMEHPNDSVVLVTNHFHVYRSVRIAKKQGMETVEGLGAPIMWYTAPNLYLREALAVIKYALCRQI